MVTAMPKVDIVKEGKISAKALEEINKVNVLTDRVKKRKQEYLAATSHLCAERSRLVTESWKETEGMPVVLRRAKLFQKIMEGISVAIWDDELIVGSQTKYLRGAGPNVDMSPESLIETLGSEKLTLSGEVLEGAVTEEERLNLLEDLKYWKVHAPGVIAKKLFDEKEPGLSDYRNANILTLGMGIGGGGGGIIDFNKVMENGINGIRKQIEEAIEKLDFSVWGDWQKYEFLQAGLICCDAVVRFAGRYAELAREMAAKEKDEVRKRELEQIAENCEWVPANPPRTFHEALQSFRFVYLAINLLSASAGEPLGRMDQCFFPSYEKDILEGRITRQEAAELLGCLWVKLIEMQMIAGMQGKQMSQSSQSQDITIGGVTKEGKDATNDLTFLLLEVTRQMKLPQPPLYLRCHQGTPEELWLKAIETNRDVAGMPAFMNDAVVLLKMVDSGVPLTEARNYVTGGCIAYHVPGGSVSSPGGFFNKAKIFELTLNDGIDPMSGKQLGLKTGDPRNFKSYEELYNAFLKQVEYMVEIFVKRVKMMKQISPEFFANPLLSILQDDCIEKGKDLLQPGVLRYPWLNGGDYSDIGHQNVADGLTAIKKLVFEEKKLSMGDLLDALKVNFAGKEDIRRMLLSAPKYGNDDDYADDIFNAVSLDTTRIMAKPLSLYGKPMHNVRGGASQHYWGGKTVGALPDGRKAWEPTADANLSPVQGMDTKGPTAVFLSASKVNHQEYAYATLLNMKIMPTILKTKEGMRNLISLIKIYFERGGYHVQFNMIDSSILLDAKKHPEKHRELVVRVAGYSAYFVELVPKMQDEIIHRTLHSF
jgi:pyruvate formate-lyase/glycerol dehydratase family glycyl radical enzyme